MIKKPRILITNDDGIFSPGIKHLWKALSSFADLSIAAPASEKSCSGLATTMYYPLEIHPVSWENKTPAWTINGTPADCVKMALSVLLANPPEMIVSGINPGSNSGRNLLYSGTVGGIIEGTFRNIPGIAFSCESFENPNYSQIEKYIEPIVRYFLNHSPPSGSFLNVTFPETSQEIQGIKMARQGKGHWIENPDQRKNPDGRFYYWLGGYRKMYEEEKDSDVFLLKQGYVTVVPIHVSELTDHPFLNLHKSAFESSQEELSNQLPKALVENSDEP